MAPGEPATAGERWSRELLADLRAGGYRSPAWAEFLRRSVDRAAAARRARPALRGQAHAWLVAWLAASAAARARPLARLLPPVSAGSELRWWATTVVLLRWHLGMVEGPRGEPRERLEAADALALGRVWLAPRLAGATESRTFLALLALANASDAIDGPLARRSGVTRLGRELDRLADLCASGCALGAARRAEWIAPWAMGAFALRYAGGVGYVVANYFLRGTAPPTAPRGVARAATPAFAIGLAAGARGAYRTGSAAVAGASLAILAAQARAARGSAQAAVREGASRSACEAAIRSASTAEPARRRSSRRPCESSSSTV